MSRTRHLSTIALTAVFAALALTACSAGPSDNTPDQSNAATGEGQNQAAEYVAPAQHIIYPGSLTLSTPDLNTTADAAAEAARAAGGFVGGDQRTSNDRTQTATLTLRIPSEAFMGSVDTIAALGDETARRLSVEDAGQKLTDLDSRIESQRASVERVRALMNEALSLSDVVSLEAELTQRESTLAELLAAKRGLDDKIAYSTLTVNLSSPVEQESASPPGFWSGLSSGWGGFVLFVGVIATVLGAVLPFVVAFGVPGFGLWVWLRRRKGYPVWGRRPRTPQARVNPYVSG